MLLVIERASGAIQCGNMLVDTSNSAYEEIVRFWKEYTHARVCQPFVPWGKYAQEATRNYRFPSSAHTAIPEGMCDAIRKHATRGVLIAAQFAHPNFPVFTTQSSGAAVSHINTESTEWWAVMVQCSIMASPDDHERDTAWAIATFLMELRILFHMDAIDISRIGVEIIPADPMQPYNMIATVWIPITTHRLRPMAAGQLTNLEPGLLMSVIRNFVRERLRIKANIYPPHSTAPTTTGPPNIMSSYDTMVLQYRQSLLPDVVLDTAITADTLVAPRRPRSTRQHANPALTHVTIPTGPLPSRTQSFANDLRARDKEIPQWAIPADNTRGARIVPDISRHTTPCDDMELMEIDRPSNADNDDDIMNLLGF